MDQGKNNSIISAITAAGNYAGLWAGSLDNHLGRLREWVDFIIVFRTLHLNL